LHRDTVEYGAPEEYPAAESYERPGDAENNHDKRPND
jgi:hypothetical protein